MLRPAYLSRFLLKRTPRPLDVRFQDSTRTVESHCYVCGSRRPKRESCDRTTFRSRRNVSKTLGWATAPMGTPAELLRATLESFPLSAHGTKATLGKEFPHLNKDAILSATAKALKVARGESEPDDREHEAFQRILGPEDLFAERLATDHNSIRRKLAWKAARTGTLDHIPSGALTPQIRHVITGSGLATNLEEINPFESLDRAGRITPMGEGGLPDTDAVPSEARSLRPSVIHFQDPARTVESLRVGVDVNAALGTRKGPDGKLYSLFRDARTGEHKWLTAADLLGKTISHSHNPSDVYESADERGNPISLEAGVANNRDDLVDSRHIDYRPASFHRIMSPLAAMLAFKPGIKPHRVSMGARMLTQTLPLVEGETPHVQAADPENPAQSAWSRFGEFAGAVKAHTAGRVEHVQDNKVTVRQDNGEVKTCDLATHRPNNRKTGFHQTPARRSGPEDHSRPGAGQVELHRQGRQRCPIGWDNKDFLVD
ncbi:MAG: hypothetical protein U0798_21405 [Gemmataceae bacterium]